MVKYFFRFNIYDPQHVYIINSYDYWIFKFNSARLIQIIPQTTCIIQLHILISLNIQFYFQQQEIILKIQLFQINDGIAGWGLNHVQMTPGFFPKKNCQLCEVSFKCKTCANGYYRNKNNKIRQVLILIYLYCKLFRTIFKFTWLLFLRF
ncbi:unnamed protein product [Paramecium pentaurelia]|uniref:Transmembrane protein n=1 Tax=Paramecium pentaurelia TaxID=43138 RepID=A0A8S1VBF0_9CILI|nr:unnamed protein product [Paramecium pentaurelia]